MAGSSAQVPGWVVSGILCLLLSSGATVLVMLYYFDYKQGRTVYEIQEEARAMQGANNAMTKVPQKGGGGDAGSKGDGRKGLSTIRPADQIVTLVEKLDELTTEPAKVQLTADQRAKLRDQLAPLAEPDFLGDAIAKQHMDAILEVLKDQRKTLEAAGFAWPEGESSPNVRPRPNPFKEGEGAKHLRALQERLKA